MQLPTYQRRLVVEELLDINVFSKMNVILKEKFNALKAEIKDTATSIEMLNEKISLSNKHLSELTSFDDEKKNQIRDDISEFEKEVATLVTRQAQIQTELQESGPDKVGLDRIALHRRELVRLSGQIKGKLTNYKSQKNFFEVNATCPTCKQEMSQEIRTSSIAKLNKDIDTTEEGLGSCESACDEMDAKYNTANEFIQNIQSKARDLTRVTGNITSAQSKITTLTERLNKPSVDTTKGQELINKLNEDKIASLETRDSLSETKTYFDALYELLKDTGIKTKIIKEYLPVMNNLINKHLQVLDFFVSFNLDENFVETIKSRYRDEFTYPSFSEGEKQRIDLALLFSWRQIAKMKNSANTNLLMLDETFDSSLDSDGVENLLKILYTLGEDTNTFIISHKQDMLEGKFPAKIEFEKQNNFSKIKKN
jgi:hypothetical protein